MYRSRFACSVLYRYFFFVLRIKDIFVILTIYIIFDIIILSNNKIYLPCRKRAEKIRVKFYNFVKTNREGLEMADNKSKNSIFREKSIDRAAGPESLNDYIRVTSPSVWIALISLLVLLAGLLTWSIFGRVEVKDADGNVKQIAPITYVIN